MPLKGEIVDAEAWDDTPNGLDRGFEQVGREIDYHRRRLLALYEELASMMGAQIDDNAD